MVQIVWIGAGRLRLFFLVRVGGTDMSNTRGALYSKPRQEIYVKTGTLGVPTCTRSMAQEQAPRFAAVRRAFARSLQWCPTSGLPLTRAQFVSCSGENQEADASRR